MEAVQTVQQMQTLLVEFFWKGYADGISLGIVIGMIVGGGVALLGFTSAQKANQ